MTIPTEPLFIGSRYVQIKFYAAVRNPGDPSTIVGTLTLMPDENVLVLDALKGDKGEKGDPAPFWRPEWQSTITNPADLNDLELSDADAGRAWYISGYWHVWTGDEFIPFLGAIPGPPGPTPMLSMTAKVIPMPESGPYGAIQVNPSGTPEEPHFELEIPGIPGPKGDNARIAEAEDVYGSFQEGQALVWSATAGGPLKPGFAPGDPSPNAVGYLTFPEYVFGPGGTFSQARTVVLNALVPASPKAYYPKVDGHLRWRRSGLFNTAQVEVEVRWLPNGSTDSPETGTLIGRALYDPSTLDAETIAHIRDHFSDSTDPSAAVGPDTSVGRIPAGQDIRLIVILRRSGGSGNYTYATAGSHLSLEQIPVS
ncbi:minor tail protein [Mycobacterium phage Gravaillia]|uniref:Minor tail protein n=1 Tax=Mycobacterium phage Gancho TaxID=2301613 RepID=A0A385UED5_9CAUD|nr:minor tail protein [Mycobacterium phage Gancho]WAB10134.1 minor tail protein [Mycobacterium phage Gravaillia]